MITYAFRRLGHALLVLWATFTATFFLLYVLPGDAALSKAGVGGDGATLSPAELARVRADLGLDQPVVGQYATALLHALRGDFGTSTQTGAPALSMYVEAVPETLKLAGAALLLGLVAGTGWALLAAWTRWRLLRQALLALPAVGVSIPTFWIGLLLIQVVSFRWQLLPAIGNDGVRSLVLPALVLAVPTAAMSAQILSRSLEATLHAPYVETARARGASRSRVLLRHALRNSVLPVVTALGMTAGHLVGGSVIMETVFSRSGVGAITVRAVNVQDTPVVLVAVVFAAVVFVGVNLLVDLLYPVIDPRIQLRTARRTGLLRAGVAT
ncbi:ABC transporter permease [Micromonospora echinofusca]|uniref:ABC transporter permease subunit n=1 Tax=Micromonospora echinofusca TaxID=47858 RepID=A0ABS3VQJ6_MICEH|nr:ABC transporter permease [Micromonospora echinofusca]MBO4206775.1 ABC transporter permease subunit [Micromonospora echinofusca]